MAFCGTPLGDDSYRGTQQAQASALFGAALLVDGGGNNQFVATSHSQAHAIGGLAVLLSSPGNDQFTAQTHAQGSAGPQAVAVLIDPAGNDRYTLNNTPLVLASAQLPDRNTSMGQGAGRGVRADLSGGRSLAGGIGILLDLAGDDHYVAQVFAQGAGYYEGLGLLVDDAGSDGSMPPGTRWAQRPTTAQAFCSSAVRATTAIAPPTRSRSAPRMTFPSEFLWTKAATTVTRWATWAWGRRTTTAPPCSWMEAATMLMRSPRRLVARWAPRASANGAPCAKSFRIWDCSWTSEVRTATRRTVLRPATNPPGHHRSRPALHLRSERGGRNGWSVADAV